jgi:hypothetical protein
MYDDGMDSDQKADTSESKAERPKRNMSPNQLANLNPPLKPGHSMGRPKDSPEVKAKKEKVREVIKDLRKHAIQHTAEMFEITCELARHGKNESVRLAAAESILSRGHGKAVSIDVNGELQRELSMAIERIKVEFKDEEELLLRIFECLASQQHELV